MKKQGLLALAVAAVIGLSMPVMAETFTSSDGVLSIDLPNENWKQVTDFTKWLSFSDGGNQITVEHLSNGEKLPEMTVADDHYVNVYQAVFSTQNEVFIITGSVVDAASIPEIANAIVSTKVLQYDTKLAVKKDAQSTISASEFSIASLDKTMYVTSNGLNVRSGCSTSDQIIGAFAYASSVHVIGSVQRNGADIGWYQVSYNNGTGYVSSEFLSDTQPEAKSSASTEKGVYFTGEAKTIYEIDGHAVTVYKASDGYWYDNAGMKYNQITDYDFTAANGATLTINKPQSSSNAPVSGAFTVYWENGNTTSLTQYSDGYYYSAEWVRYTSNGDGTFSGADGTKLYSSDPWNANIGTNGSAAQHTLVARADGGQVTVYESNGALLDNYGNNYYYTDDGTVYDDAGNFYDMIS